MDSLLQMFYFTKISLRFEKMTLEKILYFCDIFKLFKFYKNKTGLSQRSYILTVSTNSLVWASEMTHLATYIWQVVVSRSVIFYLQWSQGLTFFNLCNKMFWSSKYSCRVIALVCEGFILQSNLSLKNSFY
jgi:hypothetical protein